MPTETRRAINAVRFSRLVSGHLYRPACSARHYSSLPREKSKAVRRWSKIVGPSYVAICVSRARSTLPQPACLVLRRIRLMLLGQSYAELMEVRSDSDWVDRRINAVGERFVMTWMMDQPPDYYPVLWGFKRFG